MRERQMVNEEDERSFAARSTDCRGHRCERLRVRRFLDGPAEC